MGFADFWPRWRPAGSNIRLVALLGAVALAVMLAGAPAATADTGDPLSYYGGPVGHSMQGIVVGWGSAVNSIYTDDTTGDPGLIKYLQASSGSPGNFSGVLAQYSDRHGNAAPDVTYGGQITITPNDTSTTLDDQQIQTELVTQIENGVLPPPSGRHGLGTIYLLLFPAGYTECIYSDDTGCSGTDICAYHGDAQLADGSTALYAVLPDNTSGPMSQGCGPASTPLANQTSFMSHEWSEAITDPLVGEATSDHAWPLAWYDNHCSSVSAVCGEIGDKCNALQGLNGPWTVQLEWSNLDSTCESSEPAYSAPTAAFASDASTFVDQSVSFDGSVSSDPASNTTSLTYQGTQYPINPGFSNYTWHWDDTTSDTGETATHTFSEPGLYQVSLTVTDNLGFTSTVTHPVVVWSNSPPVAPDVSTSAAGAVDYQSATLNGLVNTQNQPALYSFAYGTSADSLSQSTPAGALGASGDLVQAGAALSGLAASTPYYYRLDVQIGGQTYSGDVQSFTTAKAPDVQQGSGGSSSGSGSGSGTATVPPAPTVPAASPSIATRLPAVATGGVSGLSSSGATVDGSVDPQGVQTSYLVEYGMSTAYGHSSAPASAGAGTSSVPVRASLTGLRPRTVYHYRVLATSSAGTAVGADRTFKTPAAPPRAPRFSFAVPSRITLAQALSGKLRVRFRCNAACTAHFTVTVALPGIQRVQAIAITYARGSGRVARPGFGTARLAFTSAARSALRSAHSVKLVISGYAVRGSSAPSAPATVRLSLTR